MSKPINKCGCRSQINQGGGEHVLLPHYEKEGGKAMAIIGHHEIFEVNVQNENLRLQTLFSM
jgi:hypothetical protein